MNEGSAYAKELVAHYEADDKQHPRRNREGEIQPVTPLDWMMRAATTEWKCLDCDSPALLLGPAGGELPFECDCDHSDLTNVGMALLIAGKRLAVGTAASLNGPRLKAA